MRSEKLDDSLDGMGGRHKSPSPKQRQDKERARMFQIKQKFVNALSKLQSSETRELALKEIRMLMDKNREPEYLRLYVSLLRGLKIEGSSSSTKEHEILIFSLLAEIFKTSLIDPIDKPAPSVVKTVFRLIEMLHLYFVDNTNTVQQACARVLIDIGKYVLEAEAPSCPYQVETTLNLLFYPLTSILKSGVDKASQSTAAVCINQLILYWKHNKGVKLYEEMLNVIYPEILSVSLKLNCEYNEFFSALVMLIQLKGLEFFGDKIVPFVAKILGVINKSQGKHTEHSNSFNSYMSKVNVCRIVEKIGGLIQSNPDLLRRLDEMDVIPSLEKASRNRVIQVQTAAHRALKAWKGELIEPQEPKRPSSAYSSNSRPGMLSLENARKQKRQERSTSRENQVKLESELNYMKEDLDKLVKGGWGPHKRANNYVKKNTGVGGGYCSKMEGSPNSSKPTKSHKEHIQELRDFIKQNAKQHKDEDKFMFYQQKKPKQKHIGKGRQEQMDFMLDEDGGDQMVNMAPTNNIQNRYISNIEAEKNKLIENEEIAEQLKTENIEMNQQQMKELLNKEKEIMEWDKQKNKDLVFGSLVSDLEEEYDQVKSLEELRKSKQHHITNIKKEMPEKSSIMGELELQFDGLSNVSSNLEGLLNQSQMKAAGFTPHQESSSLPLGSAKREASSNHFTLNPAQVQPTVQMRNNSKQTPNFSSKFNSYEHQAVKEDQIVEKLDYSQYQESMPKDKGFEFQKPVENVEDLYRKTVEHGREIEYKTRHKSEEDQSIVFQEMIKNPPKSHLGHRLDRASHLEEQVQSEKVEKQEEQQQQNITDRWQQVLTLVEQGQLNQAYTKVFEMDDPIYLLRLMLITQIPLTKLTPQNITTLWTKFLDIYQHRFIDNIFVQMFKQGNKLGGERGLKGTLTIQETNDLLLQLYELSGRTKGKLSYSAASLYNSVQESLNQRR